MEGPRHAVVVVVARSRRTRLCAVLWGRERRAAYITSMHTRKFTSKSGALCVVLLVVVYISVMLLVCLLGCSAAAERLPMRVYFLSVFK